MKLFYSPASPYVRKVMVLLHEAGLDAKVERVAAGVSPVKANADLQKLNPLAKLPSLITGDGEALYDSPVICEYIDHLASLKLFPAPGPKRWTALRRQALADGILDASILVRYEATLRPEDKRWADWDQGQWQKVEASLGEIEREVATYGDTFDIGTISVACALGYLDFRFGDRKWRAKVPKTAAWFDSVSERPSLKATKPA